MFGCPNDRPDTDFDTDFLNFDNRLARRRRGIGQKELMAELAAADFVIDKRKANNGY